MSLLICLLIFICAAADTQIKDISYTIDQNGLNSSQPLHLQLSNLTSFHPTSTSLVNITIHSNIDKKHIINEPLDLFVSFILNAKYITVKINMNNTANNAITTTLYPLSALDKTFSNLLPLNLHSFNNIFPLQFIIENHPNNNIIIFKYKPYNIDHTQQYQFDKPFQSNEPLNMLKIIVHKQYKASLLHITQFDIKYNIIIAEYLLTIRNTNIYDTYPNKYTINNKLTLAMHQYFKHSSYIVTINGIKYNIQKHDTDITFQIQHYSYYIPNAQNIQSIYLSYKDPTFYYLLALHLNLEWNNNENAEHILKQFQTGDEINVKRNFMSIYLIDWPYSNNINISQPAFITTNTKTISTTPKTQAITPLMDNILAKNTNQNSTSNEIMTWTTFIIVVIFLLLFIFSVGTFIFYLNIKIRKLQDMEKQNKHKSVDNHQNIMAQSPSNKSNSSEGGNKAKPEKPNRIAIGNGLGKIHENIPQPPSAKLVGIKSKSKKQLIKRSSHARDQLSMEFDVHLSDVVVGDAIVMDDIIDDMNNDDNDDDLVMKSEVETPFSDITPGGDSIEHNFKDYKNLDVAAQPIPDDTEDDTDQTDENDENDKDDDGYYGDLTPQGPYRQQTNQSYKE